MADYNDDPMDIELDVEADIAEQQAQAISAAQTNTHPPVQ